MAEGAPAEEDFSKLPIDDCIVHKSWKARLSGFERAGKHFASLDPKDAQFQKYLNIIKNFASESNVVALEKALDALLTFATKCNVAPKTAGEVCPILVQKCLGSPKVKIREKTQEILMMYIEIEKHEIVLDAMIEGFAAKNPKLVAACVSTITLAVSNFGAKALGVKSAAKGIAGLLEHANNDVRKEGKALAIELYSWVGKSINPQLTGIKPIQMTELENEFSSIKVGEKSVTKYLRSQQPTEEELEKLEEETQAQGQGSSHPQAKEVVKNEVDPWDFLDPVDVLSKMPTDFEENVSAAKWSTRKDALDALLQLINDNPKLDPKQSYGEIVATLRKLITKDNNINVVAVAAACLAGIANGLRKKFGPLAPSVTRDVLEKFKEKKPIVVKALTEAIDAIAKSTTLEVMSEDILASLEHKTPTVKMQTALFLSRIFRTCNQQTLPKKLLKQFMAPLVKNMGDPELTVRESTAAAIGAAMKGVGEKAVLPCLVDIVEDKLKMGKINEFRDKIASECGNELVTSMVQSMHKTNVPAASEPKVAKPATPKTNGAKQPVKKIVGAKAKPKAGAAVKKPPTSVHKVVEEREISNEEVDEQAEALIPEATRTQLESANWKERLEAFTAIFNVVNKLEASEVPVQVVVRLINRKKEMNFQVLNKRFEIYSALAEKCVMSSTCIGLMLPELLDKLGDAKQVSLVKDALIALSESVGLRYIVHQICPTLMDMKSPKCQSEGLSWISTAITDFGLDVDVKMVIEMAQKGLSSSNATIRTAAVELCGTLYLFFGPNLRSLFSAEKQALLTTLDSEFQKHDGKKCPPPTRKRRGQPEHEAKSTEGAVEEEAMEEEEQPDPADLLRKDIGAEITDEILTKMGDSNWKVREEGLSQVKNIIGEFQLAPNLATLPEALCARLKDSNKNLANTALEISTKLISAVGPRMREHIRMLAPGIIGLMGDSKPAIRDKAAASLKSWVEICGLKDFLEGELIVDAFKDNNPMLRAEIWKWLSVSLPEYKKKLPDGDLKSCVPTLFVCLEDRNAEVRKQAQEVLTPLMSKIGYEFMKRASERLKPASLKTISEMLEKAKMEVVADKSSEPSTSRSEANRTPRKAESARGTSSSRKPESARGKEADESLEGAPLILTGQKKQRFNEEKSLKLLKWQFVSPTEDHVQQLKNQLSTVCKPALYAQMVHSDFKQHLKALDSLLACTETAPECVVDCSDLLMRWCSLRFFETNPATVMKCLEFVDNIMQIYVQQNIDIDDNEVNSFVPYLLLKAGDPKEAVRKLVRQILNRMDTLYPSAKLFPILLEGLKTKNSRQKAECLKIIAESIELMGISVCGQPPAVAIKVLAQNIGDRDKDVRDAALTTMVAAHMRVGEKLYKYIGSSMSDKDTTLLNERLKRVKSRPVIKKASPERESSGKVVRGSRVMSRDNSIGAPGRDVDEDGPPIKKRPNGMFTLDDDVDVVSPSINLPKPDLNLIDHEEVNGILRSKPIETPKTKSARGLSPSRRRASVTSISSIGSMDASMALDSVISQVACAGIDTATNAAAQLEELLNDPGKACLLSAKVNQVLTAISMQLRTAFLTHMAEQSDKSLVIMLYRNLCAMLLALLNIDELAKEAGHGQLKDLAAQMLSVLLDERLESTQDGNQIVKSINVLIVKVVDKSEPTECLLALMKLLQESLRSHTSSAKFQELVMKCLWKHCRRLSVIAKDLRLGEVLQEAHTFFVLFPPAHWKTEKVDTPMRTIKTLLNGLCKELGTKALDAVAASNIPPDSEMVYYLKKCLRDVKPAENGESNGHPMPVSSSSNDNKMQISTEKKGTGYNSEMSEIFKKIADKEKSKQGISELYEFTQRHPEVDMNPFLKKSSAFFQSYIHRNLELEAQKRIPGGDENSTKVQIQNSEIGARLEKLSKMREQMKFAPSKITVTKRDTDNDVTLPAVRSTPVSSRDPERETVRPSTTNSQADFLALRKRVTEIKNRSTLT